MAVVDTLGPDDVPEVVSVLCDAFGSYPVMRFVLGPAGDYSARLHTLISFFVMSRVLRHEGLIGVRDEGGLRACALVSDPASPSPPSLDPVRERTWAELGDAARRRYTAFAAATAPFTVEVDHVHLNMVGVRSGMQGLGLGRSLLEAVHALSESHPSSMGVTLSTEVESNVLLYEYFGYHVLGTAVVGPELTTWVMYRPNP